ncbi:cell wall-associated NlpC family hydrolase [Nocardioides ginsengisegetis]|uniref:Cell wall-associated NlpC family hydrolase n=1 Tax=Nocardioides ginsengisegetis TaxID=661491 RepID=A0A7W3J0C5_9ACTN|nr:MULTISPECIES: NlpC/P60 family protein [Nocardioides]MBA8803978.1 cell wall-associated NlpC family hydrolase [Nocardioides ginsengisegetis]
MSGIALAATVGVIPSSPAQAEPNIDDVQARVDHLYHVAEQASERYNNARIQLRDLSRDLKALKADQDRQDAKLSVVQGQVQDSIVRQYEGEGLNSVGQVVVSDDPSAFLSKLSTMSAFNDLQSSLFEDYSTEVKALDIRREAYEKRSAEIAATKEKLAKEKATIEDKLNEAKSLLGKLQAEQRQALLSRDTSRLPSVSASGGAAAALNYAMAQVGDAYVYGATGPDAYDCSGLTMMAWAQAGVALPHSSSAQYSSGPHIAESDLQPGDLVFYYSPISHVGMYIGNGLIVNAENPSAGVKVTGLHTMPYVGAVRPG